MPTRSLLLASLACLLALPPAARAADPDKSTGPVLAIRTRPLADLVEDARHLVKFMPGDPKDAAKTTQQLEDFLKSLEGIDAKKPLGFYANSLPGLLEGKVVFLVPIIGEKAFVDMLERSKCKVTRGDGGLYSFTTEEDPTVSYFRFANHYAYLTPGDKASLPADGLPEPATVLPPEDAATLVARLSFKRIPEAQKKQMLGQLQDWLAKIEKDVSGDTAAERAFQVAVLHYVKACATDLVDGADELTLRASLDRKKSEIAVDATLTARSGSKLAESFRAIKPAQSLFTGLKSSPDDCARLHITASVPRELHKSWSDLVDVLVQKGLAEEKDKGKQEINARLARALTPTLRAGELDLLVNVRGPMKNKKGAMVAAIKLQDGAKIEKEFRDSLKALPADEQAKIKVDAETVGKIKVHRTETNVANQETFGKEPTWIAFRNDAAFLAMGEGGLDMLKEALEAKPGSSPGFEFALAGARVLDIAMADKKDAEKGFAMAFLGLILGQNKDLAVWLRLNVEGGDSLKVHAVTTPVGAFQVLILGSMATMGQKPPDKPPVPGDPNKK